MTTPRFANGSAGTALAALALLTCTAISATGQEVDKDPIRNFDAAWHALDKTYGQFVNKRVDWDVIYRVYRADIDSHSTEAELFDVIARMIRHLNDGHVWLRSTDRVAGSSGNRDAQAVEFSRDVVVRNYLGDNASNALDGAIIYGWAGEGVGYIHIRDFQVSERAATAAMDKILQELSQAAAMIVDVRGNPGGTGQVANRLADRFADRRRHFMSSRMRYGPAHDDTLPMHFHVQPRGAAPFTRPTILLTNRSTASAAERFTLAMRVLPHVTIIGEFTAGAFSVQYPRCCPMAGPY